MWAIASTGKLIATAYCVTVALFSWQLAVARASCKDEPAAQTEPRLIDLEGAARKIMPAVSNGLIDEELRNNGKPNDMSPLVASPGCREKILYQCFVAEGVPAKMRERPSLSLNSGERAEIWRSLGKQAGKTSVPSGLRVGEVVPTTMHLRSFARDIRKKIPAIGSYSYALLHNQVLATDPRSKKIVFIVAE